MKGTIHDTEDSAPTILLAGNPNVGKSTIFNALTGLHQHTGNWTGKTVDTAAGWFSHKGGRFRLLDLPGTYSLSASSPEEEITRDAICFANAERVLLVTDAVGLERNLYLTLQSLAVRKDAVLCVNLMDEAEKRGIKVDLDALSETLGVPVVGVTARKKKTLLPLLDTLSASQAAGREITPALYPPTVYDCLLPIGEVIKVRFPVTHRRAVWMAATLLAGDDAQKAKLYHWCGEDLSADGDIGALLSEAWQKLNAQGVHEPSELCDALARHWLRMAKEIADSAVHYANSQRTQWEWKLDRLLTSRAFGIPIMLLLLLLIFALTIRGADLPSQVLGSALFWLGERLSALLLAVHCPGMVHDALIFGAYRMLAWVVSVMLPPMLIFFPLFTALEDVGYLPRISFQLDHSFQRCGSCGKQALTMGMGLGCNAVGVTGCRIIASKKERLLAILTNSFVPCNGRFPMMILLIGAFLAKNSALAALILCGCVCLAVAVTFAVTKLISRTVLKGKSSLFLLELPPYRPPQIGQILVRSLLDRTVFILGRAAAVAAPAGLLLWALGTMRSGDQSLLTLAAAYLDPLGRLMGMDGVILLAFILGSAANETVIPIAMMIYLSASALSGSLPTAEIRQILLENGWTWLTAASTLLFTMMHWPCTTTLLTIRKETRSAGWTFLAALLPTVCGMLSCMVLHALAALFHAI